MFQNAKIKNRVIFLTSHLPYPPNMGDKITIFNTIKGFLEAGWEVNILSLGHKSEKKYEKDLKSFGCSVKLIQSPPKLLSILSSIFSNKSAIFNRFYSKNYEVELIKISSDADIIYAHHSYMSQYFDCLKSYRGLKIQDIHVIESNILFKKLNDFNILLKVLLMLDLFKLRKNEIKSYHNSNLNYVYGEFEYQQLILKFKNIRFRHAPVNINLSKNFVCYSLNMKFAYFGDYRWFPNLDGLNYVLTHVWPLIKDKIPGASLYIAGRFCPDNMKELISFSGAIYVGEVNDIDDFLSDIAVVLSPIRIGGGVRLKILESLSKGKVVIANKISSEGISDKTVLIVEDSPLYIAEKINDLLRDSNKFYEMQYRAWKYARDYHSIGVTTIELLESFCNESDLK